MHEALLKELRSALEDRFAFQREIGRGLHGTVFLARDRHERDVALKVLNPDLLQDSGDRARILRELGVVARLQHPHILPIIDSGEAAGLFFYCTPFLAGVSLRTRIRHGPLSRTEALQIAEEVADALTYAHAHGVLHRDIQPDNVFVVDGWAVVKDFWVARALSRALSARLTRGGRVIGTPGYMSPEELSGEPNLDGRSDVYALAVLICEMMTQRLPLAGAPLEVARQQLTLDQLQPDDFPGELPEPLVNVLVKALAKDRKKRFANPHDLVRACLAATGVGEPLVLGSAPKEKPSRVATETTGFGEPFPFGSAPKEKFSRVFIAEAHRRSRPLGVLISIFGVTVALVLVGIVGGALPWSTGLAIVGGAAVGLYLFDRSRTHTGLKRSRPRPVVSMGSVAQVDLPGRLRRALQHQYDVGRELGRGGMAIVYLAQDLRYRRRKVALKVLRPEYALAIGSERFIDEIEIMAALSHPGILTVLDYGDADGMPFFVMPYVEGEDLKSYMNRNGQLPVSFAVGVMSEVARALDYAHRKKIVHRDIKPENILLHEGRAIVADFGIALALDRAAVDRRTLPEISLGTPEFMSPEQFSDTKHIDSRTDVYGLGCVLYEMLAAVPPYSGTREQLKTKHLKDPVPHIRQQRSDVPEAIDQAICKALAKDRNERFETAGQFSAALVLEGNQIAVSHEPR